MTEGLTWEDAYMTILVHLEGLQAWRERLNDDDVQGEMNDDMLGDLERRAAALEALSAAMQPLARQRFLEDHKAGE